MERAAVRRATQFDASVRSLRPGIRQAGEGETGRCDNINFRIRRMRFPRHAACLLAAFMTQGITAYFDESETQRHIDKLVPQACGGDDDG